MGAMLFMYTGDFVHNISMRSIAKRRGWKLDQYGIWDAKTGKPLLQSPDERDFYDFLGVDWHDPEDRSFKDRPKKKK
jgi:DNA polymerase (family 10)